MKLNITKGTTSFRTVIQILDNNGLPITGLTNASSGLTWYYWRSDTGNAGGTSVSIVSATRGTFTSGGFVEVDATNLPGYYEIGVPNAAIATGSNWCVMKLKGVTASNMSDCNIEFELTSFDLYTATVTLAAAQLLVKKNTAMAGFTFVMVTTAGAAGTGLTVTAKRSIDGGAAASCTNSVTELSLGIYSIDLSAADLNGTMITLLFTATGAFPKDFSIITQP